ncbi:MAG: hypothetical protein U0903_08760 [Planctomycetales bacterium]
MKHLLLALLHFSATSVASGQTYLKATPRISDPIVTAKGVPNETPFFIGLQAAANLYKDQALNNPAYNDNNLEKLPDGFFKTEGGIPFEIEKKLIGLKGRLAPTRPASVRIDVGRPATALYFLHGSFWGGIGRRDMPAFAFEKDNTTIGMYVVTYEDDDVEFIPIVYGKDVRDWWGVWDNFQPTKASDVVWRGTNDFIKKRDEAKGIEKPLRLYMTAWKNPFPTQQIKHIEFLSEGSVAAPFCVAITGYAPKAGAKNPAPAAKGEAVVPVPLPEKK